MRETLFAVMLCRGAYSLRCNGREERLICGSTLRIAVRPATGRFTRPSVKVVIRSPRRWAARGWSAGALGNGDVALVGGISGSYRTDGAYQLGVRYLLTGWAF